MVLVSSKNFYRTSNFVKGLTRRKKVQLAKLKIFCGFSVLRNRLGGVSDRVTRGPDLDVGKSSPIFLLWSAKEATDEKRFGYLQRS